MASDGGAGEEGFNFLQGADPWEFVQGLVSILTTQLNFFFFVVGGGHKGGKCTWEDWGVSVNRVHDVKFQNNQ